MEIDRPHRTTSTPTTTSELFICFTSRLSKSSSMRLSSKSILSPARSSDKPTTQPHSLSTSLSRRLRHNGSLRGAQSPAMFPSKKTRGSSGFADNPEPSSPKVTCIGQVRVKTKKQGKKMKMRACRSKSKRLSGGGEASFRRIEHPLESGVGGIGQGGGQATQECRNQKWVHLPLTICEALRAFGNEFSCLFPCKSSCFSGKRGGEERENDGGNSCAVFRWLVSLQEGEGEGKRRDIELVVGGDEREVRGESVMIERECSRRRSIFDDMEFDDLFNNVKNDVEINNDGDGNGDDDGNDDDGGGGSGRVSICIPPKNALLLMRCRSDPIKMASLSHKLWDVSLPQDHDHHDNNDNDNNDNDDDDVNDHDDGGSDDDDVEEREEVKMEEKIEVREDNIEEGFVEEGEKIDISVEGEDLPYYVEDDSINLEEKTEENIVILEQEEKQEIENRGETQEEQQCEIKDEILENGSSIGISTMEETTEIDENEQEISVNLEENQEQVNEESTDLDHDHDHDHDLSTTITSSCSNFSVESTAESKEKVQQEEQQEAEKDLVQVEDDGKDPSQEQEQVQERKSMERENNNSKPTLPDCLLLMMCEPKVSMEVSKETWVCTTDFLKWLPERHPKKTGNKLDGSGPDHDSIKKKKPPLVQPVHRFEPAQVPVQPGRSSISFPAGGGSVANMIEQKLVKGGGGGAYEPLVLTRCKSAPMRSVAAKAAPSEMTCSLWGRENGRKLEPHRPATFGVGAAGVGF